MVPLENASEEMPKNKIYRMSTGIIGLDEILQGGFIPGAGYMLHGNPGSGKTIVGLHFLTAGVELGDKSLFITMGETEQQIRRNAELMSFDLSHVEFLDLAPSPDFFAQVQSYDIFSPSDVELEPTTERITAEVAKVKPIRVFIDAITHFRYFASDDLQFRRQVHSFLRFLIDSGATVLFTSEDSPDQPDNDLQYMSDGIIRLEHDGRNRTLSISKFRGSDFASGEHPLRLTDHGMVIFPRMPAFLEGGREFVTELISSGIPELDEMISGGIERGTVTMITGPTGVGKTAMGMQFMKAAAERSERSVIYAFEEWKGKLLSRSKNINIPVREMSDAGKLLIVPIEPLRYTPDEFAFLVRQDVEKHGASIVMIDSIASYKLSVQGEDLIRHLHTLSKYLQSKNVAVILINNTEDIIGSVQATDISASYMADTIIFLRYLEVQGELRRAVGVLKKRHSDFQKTLREFEISQAGIYVGEPLTELRGVLTGIPEWADGSKPK